MDQTLYIADLDGTLLRRDKTISPFTAGTINRLCAQGMTFSYATARSIYTAAKLTEAITTALPVVTFNGCVLLNGQTGEILQTNHFSREIAREIGAMIAAAGISPLVYGYIEGRERVSICPEALSGPALEFLRERQDARLRPVRDQEELLKGDVFYFNCVHHRECLEPLYEQLRDRFVCMLQKDPYCDSYMLELMPQGVSKANGVLQLKTLLGCDRIVAFGDGINDIPLFEAADECYAVENAVPELKTIATDVIGSNDVDGVAHWLADHVGKEMFR